MFLRIETSLKSDFTDPYAKRWCEQVRRVHSSLGEKIRWARRLEIFWIELDAPRDRVVQAVQAAFRDPVLNWVFTGDLLPSAAGPSGTLFDLMQTAPNRPGVFQGIEKRKRLNVDDERAQVTLDLLQTILGRRSPNDQLIMGELLLLEGPKIIQSDLEWIARNLFTDEKFESWSFISEDELKRNSRFQSEQVAKYLIASQPEVAAKWLQFRNRTRTGAADPKPAISVLMQADVPARFQAELNRVQAMARANHTYVSVQEWEEWCLAPRIEFGSSTLGRNTQAEVERVLLKAQLELSVEKTHPKLQTVMGVLPKKSRLWMGMESEFHPERVHDEYQAGLKRIAETTGTPVSQTKWFEDDFENNPSMMWVGSVGVRLTADTKLGAKPDFSSDQTASALGMNSIGIDARFADEFMEATTAKQSGIDLLWIGSEVPPIVNSVYFVEALKEARMLVDSAEAISFAVASTGKTLIEVLQEIPGSVERKSQMHFEVSSASFDQPLSLSQVWGVLPTHLDWIKALLASRRLPFLHWGKSYMAGSTQSADPAKVKLLAAGPDTSAVLCEMPSAKFFKTKPSAIEKTLMNEPCYVQDPLKLSTLGLSKYSVEELLIKSPPFVFRPKFTSWSGFMVLTDLFDVGMKIEDLEWMLRRCTAMGGGVSSVQASFVNGLKSWHQLVKSLCEEFGMRLTQFESVADPSICGHWCALQFISTVQDVRNVRSIDAKAPLERIYWLDGSFDQAGFRWLSGMEGRYQAGLSSAMAVHPKGVRESLITMLTSKRFGAEVNLTRDYSSGYLVTVSDTERFAIEEEWRTLDLEHEFIGKTTASPYLILREGDRPTVTLSIEDASALMPGTAPTSWGLNP